MMNTGLITLANEINHNTDVVEKVNSIKTNKNKENDIEEAKKYKKL